MTTEAERDCKHGQLKRSCNICALEAEVAQQAAEIERLTTCLKKANAQAEHFEREWHLRGDEIERLKSEAELFAKHTGLTFAAKDTLLRQALEALKKSRREHYHCEDAWYQCPKHKDGCLNDAAGTDCNCGADEYNAACDEKIAAIQQHLEI